ncbi:MAG: LptE family protein [Candidatus Omnitrophota bacterium]|nr:LptE family protein [Candidatus Omnitrophota bacterium]
MRIRTISNIFLLTISCLLAVGLSGCGYTTGSLLPSDIKTISVPMFKNVISSSSLAYQYHPGIEGDITRQTVDRFIFDGRLKVVDTEQADLVLTGEVTDYIKDPLRYGPDEKDVIEYRLTLVMRLICRDTAKDVVLWEEKRLTGDTTYFVASGEELALRAAIRDLAKNIVARMIEGW